MDQNQPYDARSRKDTSSFFIRILFRQNASWQGEVQWMEGKKTRRFRSLLELIVLLDEALESSDSPPTCQVLRQWIGDKDDSHCPYRTSTSLSR